MSAAAYSCGRSAWVRPPQSVDASCETEPVDRVLKPRGFRAFADDAKRERHLQARDRRQEHAKALLLHEAADRQQAKAIAAAGAAGRDEVADVDTMGHEDGRHAALAQACRRRRGCRRQRRRRRGPGVRAPPDRLCACRARARRSRTARGARRRARRNLRRRVGEVAVHTGDVACRAGARRPSRPARSAVPAGSITTRPASRETSGCGSAPSPGLVAKIAASAPAASSAASSPRANVSEIRGNPLTIMAMRRMRRLTCGSASGGRCAPQLVR